MNMLFQAADQVGFCVIAGFAMDMHFLATVVGNGGSFICGLFRQRIESENIFVVQLIGPVFDDVIFRLV